ncbi:MAG: hypothetical protein RI953_2823 [Pseudomonadota bacterium]
MSGQWKQLLAGLEENPGRGDLVAGVLSLCRTMQNPSEQAGLLTECSAIILRAQPVLALQMLRLALLLSPRETSSLKYAKEIFKRRGRWAAEQKVTEILATATQATAVTPPPRGIMDELADTSTGVHTRTSISAPQEQATSVRVDFELNDKDAPNDKDALFDEVYSIEPAEIPSFEPELDVQLDQLGSEASSIPPDETDSNTPLERALPVAQAEPEISQQSTIDLFDEYLTRGGFDPAWKQFSTGFSQNTSGLVAYVNLLMTMQLVSENRKTEALLILLKLINEFPDVSGGEQLFDRLFMQRSQRGDV